MLTCYTCKKKKVKKEFYKRKDSKTGYRGNCKECQKESARKYALENKDSVRERKRNYHIKNRDSILEYASRYRAENADRIREYNRIWREQNAELHREISRNYYHNNKDKVRAYKRNYAREKYNNDPLYRLKHNIRRLILQSFDRNGYTKSSKTYSILGCSFNELLDHLNDNPYGFIVSDNNIDIDHIVPLGNATTKQELKKLNHYTNLQLLPSHYNQAIKIDNPWDVEHFETWLKNKDYSK